MPQRIEFHRKDGLSIIHEPADPLVDIVVLHGFNSSIHQAFTHDNGRNWVLEKEFWGELAEKARIMTFAYNANAFHDVIVARIVDHAGKLLEDLHYARRSCRSRPLIFIAHSMGGLVTKRALVDAKLRDDRYGEILRATVAIISIATPHLGAGKTDILAIAQRLHAWCKLRSSKHVGLSQELATFSQTTDHINRTFRPMHIDIVDIYETQETRLPHGSELIVEPASAILPHPNERHLPSAATHQEICRFESPAADCFLDLWQQIDQCIDKAAHEISSSDVAIDEMAVLSTQYQDGLEASSKDNDFASSLLSAQLSKKTALETDKSLAPISARHRRDWATTVSEDSEVETKTLPALHQSPEDYKFMNQKRLRQLQTDLLSRLSGWKTYRQREDRLHRHPGTCEWIFEHTTFRQWNHLSHDSIKHAVLFLLGPSGCGKSVMAHHVAEALSNPSSSPLIPNSANPSAPYQSRHVPSKPLIHPTVLKFFCSGSNFISRRHVVSERGFTEDEGPHSVPIIEAFLYQLLAAHLHLCDLLDSALLTDGGRFEASDIERIFHRLITKGNIGHLVLLIDGLDECEAEFNHTLLEYLHNLAHDFHHTNPNARGCSLKFMISCQPIYPVPIWSCRHLTVHAQLDSIRRDIISFTNSEVKSIAQARALGPENEQFAARLLVEQSGTSFLWAALILKELREIPVISTNALQSTITGFPPHLDQYYTNVLMKIRDDTMRQRPQDSNPGRTFVAVLYSRYDLSLLEITELLAVSSGRETHRQILQDATTDITALINRQLGSLVVVESAKVSVAHHSVRTFLNDVWQLPLMLDGREISLSSSSTSAHAVMAELCLRYMLLDDFGHLPNTWYYDLGALDAKFALLKYATCGLIYHLKEAKREISHLKQLLCAFFSDGSKNFTFWQRSYTARSGGRIRSASTSVMTVLCQSGMESVSAVLAAVTERGLVGLRSFSFINLFHALRAHIHKRLSQDVGPERVSQCDVNAFDAIGVKPVHYAACLSKSKMLTRLRCDGASLFAVNHCHETALHYAACYNSIRCIDFLLASGLDIDSRDDLGLTPLAIASKAGNPEAVELLLLRGAAIDPTGDAECHPFFVAAEQGHEMVALVLLAHAPPLHRRKRNLENIVHVIAREGLCDLLDTLLKLDPGLPLDQRSASGYRPLQLAAMHGYEKIVAMLCQYGVATETETENKALLEEPFTLLNNRPPPPLYLAVAYDRTDAALELVKQNALLHPSELGWWSLLHVATSRGNIALCQAVVQASGSVGRGLIAGFSPLLIASALGHTDIVAWILSFRVHENTINPPSVFAVGDSFAAPLLLAAEYGHAHIVKLLLAAGADINTVGDENRTAIFIASCHRRSNVVKELLLWKPDLEIQPSSARTVLFQLVVNGDLEMVKRLLDAGACPEPKLNGQMFMPVHAAAYGNHVLIMKLLLESGASLTTTTKDGEMPFMLACRRGNLEIMDLILEIAHINQQVATADGSSLYHRAAGSGKVSVLDRVGRVQGPHDIDSANDAGQTPFHIACWRADIDCLRWFLNKAVDIFAISCAGTSALGFAVLSGDCTKVKFVLALGLDVARRYNSDLSVVEMAIDGGFGDILEELLRCGGNPAQQDAYLGRSPLHRATYWGDFKCIEALLGVEAPLESFAGFHDTPLLLAIARKHKCATCRLIYAGARLEARDREGRTAFELSVLMYHGFPPRRDENQQHQVDVRGMLSVIQVILANTSMNYWSISLLAWYLCRLGEYENATLFILTLALPDDQVPGSEINAETRLFHRRTCDSCDTFIHGRLYHCITCEDFDLCSACYPGWEDRPLDARECRGHAFLHVPGTDPDYPMKILDPPRYEAKIRHLIEGIQQRYTEWLLEAEASDEEDADSIQDESKIKASPFLFRCSGIPIYSHDGFITLRGPYGLPFYQSRSMWQSREEEALYDEWVEERSAELSRLDDELD